MIPHRVRSALAVTLLALGIRGAGAQANTAERPALVLLIAIDQMRGDYLGKFAPQLTGGLKLLYTQGAVFDKARQLHALTETAPGHSTMMSGREPVHTGIWSNDGGVPDPTAKLVGGAKGDGASPRRFQGTQFYDWLLAADPEAKVLSISRKDRAAILPVGRALGPVFWYAPESGMWTTSDYYADSLPAWLREFNAGLDLDKRFANREWNLLLPESAYPEADAQSYENSGKKATFPHALPAGGPDLYDALEKDPVMDSLILAGALRGVSALKIGQHPGHTDYMSVSLSTLDAIGHAWGPDSRELHDHILRVDRYLGAFFDSLAKLVPPAKMYVTLTGDHGSYSLPEWRRANGLAGGRVNPAPWVDSIGRALDAKYRVPFGITFDGGLVTADVDALRARRVDVKALAAELARGIAKFEGVARTYTPATLSALPASDENAVLWRRSLPPTLGWLAAADAKPGWVFSDSKKSEHGTHQPETNNVPIVFMGPGIKAGTYSDLINTVDIAPTLAAILGIAPLEATDGKPVATVLGQRSRR